MEKIKQLRGISSQSGIDLSDASGAASIKLVNVLHDDDQSNSRVKIFSKEQIVAPESARITSHGNHDETKDAKVEAAQA